ncbi:amidohydrolase family protein [Paraburkholderia sp. HD33-4]|uniref:amidohydrolase family protein n=1 Tax=Paraburkholderia sp. HD33-4 TaxID=2883242 RepID=UPI001F3C5BA5|nr:amidohydrolase family protein [Paraburkholderia sp. HD33-4]
MAATLPVIDAHHHLYDRPGKRYLLEDMLEDIRCGHNVRGSVFVQARAMQRAEGPEEMKPVGETEFVNGMAAMSASGIYGESRLCAGIVGYADLRLGQAIRPVLEAHIQAGGGTSLTGGRFCGIRQPATWDSDPSLFNSSYPTAPDMFESPAVGAAMGELAELGLTFDAWVLFTQIPHVTALARSFPQLRIVLDHCGGIALSGQYQGRNEEVFARWSDAIRELAKSPNVTVKLSGLGMRLSAFGFDSRDVAPSSAELASAWRPWVETCLETFGSSRCMYGSNFPVDKGSYGYGIGLNALKLLCEGATPSEKEDVFWRTAMRFYNLPQHLVN